MKYIAISILLFYAFWIILLYRGLKKRKSKENIPTSAPSIMEVEDSIVGKSTFMLNRPLPEKPNRLQEAKEESKPNVASNELDEVFSNTPESNELLNVDYPLELEEEELADEEDYETAPLGNAYATGATFEEMGAAIHTVANRKTATEQQQDEAGRVLLSISDTDLFEQLVQSSPEREDIVGSLINLHLDMYRKKQDEIEKNQGNKSQVIPPDFDMKNYV